MSFYRPSRCLEASLIDYLRVCFEEAAWTDLFIEKSFIKAQSEAGEGKSGVCVRASDTNRKRFECGSDNTVRSELILLDIFATSDGQRLDLVDFICDSLKVGFPYYEYQIEKNVVTSRIQNGRVTVLTLEDKPVNFNTNKSDLDMEDRYRHLISIVVSTGKVE